SAARAGFRSSSSTMFLRQLAAQARLEPVEPGGHIGFRDAEHVGNLLVGVAFEVEQDQRPVQIVEPRDDGYRSRTRSSGASAPRSGSVSRSMSGTPATCRRAVRRRLCEIATL